MLTQDIEILELNYSLCRKFLNSTGLRVNREAVFAFKKAVKDLVVEKLNKIKSLENSKTITKETIERAFVKDIN